MGTEPYKDFLDYILKRFPPGSNVLEFGSGEGTRKLVERFKVTSVEHDNKWLGLISNHDYIFAPIEPFANSYYREENGWYSLNILKRELAYTKYDLILVDGPPRTFGRGGFDIYFEELNLRKDVPIIFDDVHRLWEFRLMGQVGKKLGVNPVLYPCGERWFGVIG